MVKRVKSEGKQSGERRRSDSVSEAGSNTSRTSFDIFADRREKPDRRQQSLPIPRRMCRRDDDRRKNSFSSKPWWLQVSYSEDKKTHTPTQPEE